MKKISTFRLYLPFTLFIFLSFISKEIKAQDFMMQGWYWDYPKTCDGFNWADTLENKATELGEACFTYVWLPPMSRASFGNCSNGYDPKDLYDLGEYGGGATGFGTRADVDQVIVAFNANGIEAVADVVYNHRDGGTMEDNPAVQNWITTGGGTPFPSDRVRVYLPVGGSSGNGAGDYFFKISSSSGSGSHNGKTYNVYMSTNTVGFQGMAAQNEVEPNGGGDCGQGNNDVFLGVDLVATVETGGGCNTDEFHLNLQASDFDPAGDSIFISLRNFNGNYSDHRIYSIWNASAGADVAGQLKYQTATKFDCPSGQGFMDWTYFKPNNDNATTLTGDLDWLWFFYDYDQNQSQTETALFAWTDWLFNDVNIGGLRMDAIKHFEPAFVGKLMDHLDAQGNNPGMVVGEFFDSNAGLLKGWLDGVNANMTQTTTNVRIFDFSMRQALKDASDAFGYDARNVFNAGVVNAGASSFNSVTFVNNHDFRDAGQAVQNDPMLAYAYILTNNQIGIPSVFYPDYYGISIPHSPTQKMKPEIDALIKVHKDHITNSPTVEYLNRFSTPRSINYISGFPNTSLIYQIDGTNTPDGKDVVVAINFAGERLQADVEIETSRLTQDTLIDILGRSAFEYAKLDDNNRIYVDLPPRSYSVWVNCPPLIVLPAELTQFDVISKEKNVAINWETASEINVSHFELERSLDGQNFKLIHQEQANGDTDRKAFYQFTDNNIEFNTQLYYRLKIVDEDGRFEYSEVKTAKLIKEGSIQIYPNPAKDEVLISIKNTNTTNLKISILDANGQFLKSLTTESIDNKIRINIAEFSSGIYFIKMSNGVQEWTEQIVKL